MLKMNLSDIVQTLAKQLTPKDPSKGLLLEFNVTVSYQHRCDFQDRACLALLFVDARNGGYHVFSSIDNRDWTHRSSHNSCWRDDGLQDINALYFDLCENVIDKVKYSPHAEPAVEVSELAPVHLEQQVYFRSHSNPFRIVDVEVTKDPNDKYGCYRKVVQVK